MEQELFRVNLDPSNDYGGYAKENAISLWFNFAPLRWSDVKVNLLSLIENQFNRRSWKKPEMIKVSYGKHPIYCREYRLGDGEDNLVFVQSLYIGFRGQVSPEIKDVAEVIMNFLLQRENIADERDQLFDDFYREQD